MKLADTLRVFWRRWYIVVPGIIVAALITLGAWLVITPGYERSATELLIPGADSMPEGANPYLFIGGLSPAADVLVRALGAENVLNEVVEDHDGVEIEISRDTTTAGPIVLITVTADSDAEAEEVLGLLVERSATVLDDLQEEQIAPENRVTIRPISVDNESVVQQRNRLLGTAGVGLVCVVLTLLTASLVDGLSQRARRRGSSGAGEAGQVADLVPGAPDAQGASSQMVTNEPAPRAEPVAAEPVRAEPVPAEPVPAEPVPADRSPAGTPGPSTQ